MPMTVWAVLNQKGGVGKTSLALNLADAWARQGLRVLLIDVDPQASATTSLIARDLDRTTDRTLVDVLRDAQPLNALRADPAWGYPQGIDLIPAALNLEDVWASQSPGLVFRLRNALELATGEYDQIICDGPPDLGPGTVSAAVAADHVIIPTRPERMSLAGVARTVETVGLIRRDMAPRVALAAIVPMALDSRLSEHKARMQELIDAYGEVITAPVPHRLRSDEASGTGGPARSLAGPAGSVLGDVYNALATELALRASTSMEVGL
jgi:chromosome partitioning protein